MASSSRRRRDGGRATTSPRAVERGGRALDRRLAWLSLAAAVAVTPLLFDAASRDSFRLPKAIFFGLAALASFFFLSLGWRDSSAWRRLLRAPALVALAPLVVVGTLVSLASPHPEHVARGLVGLWLGGAAVWLWSAEFSRRELDRAFDWLLVSAALLALVGVLQFHDLYQPFDFATLRATSRLAITSLAGNAGDLAAFLVLPALIAQRRLADGRRRLFAGVALAICLYGLVVTQTFAATAALAAGSALFWGALAPPRRRLVALAAAALALAAALAASPPFRARAEEKLLELRRGDWNEFLTGRLDGWRAGLWMFAEHPATGVGAGAFRCEFLPAKEALLARGVQFFRQQQNPVFANAHNEVIEVGAELGVPGLLALAWAIGGALRRRSVTSAAAETRHAAIERAFVSAALAAIAVLSLFHFPFRIAIVSSGLVLFLAWLFAAPEPEAGP